MVTSELPGPKNSSHDRLFYYCLLHVVFFAFILDIKFVGRTNRGHTRGKSHKISHPPSFCGACLHFSREKDSAIPLLSLVDRKVEFCVLPVTVYSFSICWAFFIFFSEKNPVYRDSNSRPNVSEGYVSREGFSHSFPSSTVKSNFVY